MGLVVLHSMWDLPESGTEPMSLALAGGLFTTQPAGKPPYLVYQTITHTHTPLQNLCGRGRKAGTKIIKHLV